MKQRTLLTIAALTFFVTAQDQSPTLPDTDEAAYPAIERFISVMEAVRKNHPHVEQLAYERLVNRALEGMLSSLDPHSSFIHPEMMQAMESNKDLDTHIPSLGLTIGIRHGGPYVMAVTRHGPADQPQLAIGSSILAIDTADVSKTPITEILKSLTKPAGAKTSLTIKSASNPKPIEISAVHLHVPDKAITHQHLIPNEAGIGYIRLAQFTATCDKEMEAALDELEDNGMKSLILDLRGNPGGQVGATVNLLGLFLPPDTEVVSIRARGEAAEVLKTPAEQRRKRDYPICVLIDRMSASASELTAGALQDLKRATIIGEVSYGKGSVQQIVPMGANTALRLTFATYHSPSGKTPNLIGITPDLVIDIHEQDRENFSLASQAEVLPPEKQQAVKAWKDPALTKAIEQLKTPGK